MVVKLPFVTLIVLTVIYFHLSSASGKKPVTLVTFDVDGTLLQSASQLAEVGAHGEQEP